MQLNVGVLLKFFCGVIIHIAKESTRCNLRWWWSGHFIIPCPAGYLDWSPVRRTPPLMMMN